MPWERSASQIYRITEGLWRGVEEPVLSGVEGTPAMLVGRCSSELSGHRLQGKLKKSQPPSAVEGSAVPRTSPGNVFRQSSHGPGPTLGDEKRFRSSNHSPTKGRPLLCHWERSRPVPACRGGICSSSTSHPCCSSNMNCHPACPGVPWDRSVPRFPTSRTRKGHVCGFP